LEISVRIDWIVLILPAATPLIILPKIYIHTVFPNPIISEDKKLVNTEISNTGFLPYLSESAPSKGAEKIANTE